MFVLGLVLFLIGYFFGVPLLFDLGIIGMILGAVLYLLGANGTSVGGRRNWF